MITLNRYDRLGAGLGQPLAPDENGRLPLVSGPEAVIALLLLKPVLGFEAAPCWPSAAATLCSGNADTRAGIQQPKRRRFGSPATASVQWSALIRRSPPIGWNHGGYR